MNFVIYLSCLAKQPDTGAPATKNVEEAGAENDVDDDEGGDVEESSNAESGGEDEEGDIDDEEDGLGGNNLWSLQ